MLPSDVKSLADRIKRHHLEPVAKVVGINKWRHQAVVFEVICDFFEHFKVQEFAVRDGGLETARHVFRMPRSIESPRHGQLTSSAHGAPEVVVAKRGLAKIVIGREEAGKRHIVQGASQGELPTAEPWFDTSLQGGMSLEPLEVKGLNGDGSICDQTSGGEVPAFQRIPSELVRAGMDANCGAWRKQTGFVDITVLKVFPPLQDGVNMQCFGLEVEVPHKCSTLQPRSHFQGPFNMGHITPGP